MRGKIILLVSNEIPLSNISNEVVNQIDNLIETPVYTNRRHRLNESNDIYNFIDNEFFEHLKNNNQIILFHRIADIYNFVPKYEVFSLLEQGKSVVIYMNDLNLAENIMDNYNDIISIYIYGKVSRDFKHLCKYDKWIYYKNDDGIIELLKIYITNRLSIIKESISNHIKYPYLSEYELKKMNLDKPITIVLGVPCSGKSYFINKHFKDANVIDIYDIQERLNNDASIVVSQEIFRFKTIINILLKESTVLECLLLKRKRRIQLIEDIKEITNQKINLYFMCPSEQEYNSYLTKRNQYEYDMHTWDIMEYPLYLEGFDNIYYVDSEGIYSIYDFYNKIILSSQVYIKKDELIKSLKENIESKL